MSEPYDPQKEITLVVSTKYAEPQGYIKSIGTVMEVFGCKRKVQFVKITDENIYVEFSVEVKDG